MMPEPDDVRLEGLIRDARRLWGRPDEEGAMEAVRRLSLLRERRAALADALVVVILGGTKTGKTTLINALAGRPIGEASARACLTARPALFVHAGREAQARARLAGVLKPDDTVVVHQEPDLERIILVDTPDFDGVVARHHEVFAGVLERADLVLALLTTQKYDAADLYAILREQVGFRRTVFLFNRIDEGIPFSDKVRADFLAKIAGFGLRPVEGEAVDLLAISAGNAFQRKQGNAAAGPVGEFPRLEALLHQRLDEQLVRQINRENLDALAREVAGQVAAAARVEHMRRVLPVVRGHGEAVLAAVEGRLQTALAEAWAGFLPGVEGAAAARAAEGLGGIFGVYLRLSLALQALGRSLSLTGQTLEQAAGGMAQTTARLLDEGLLRLRRDVSEELDRAGLPPGPLLARFDEVAARPFAPGEEISAILRRRQDDPVVSRGEGLLLNLAPLLVVLLLVRYYALCLFTARDPSAGMFLGGLLVLGLICHLQAAFWLPWKRGTLADPPPDLAGLLRDRVRARLVDPLRLWAEEVGSTLARFGPPGI